jgi:transcriptional regulator with XRE-family HTH domain
MASNAVLTGPTAERVAKNVERIRKARQLHQKDVSALLRDVGRPMLPTVVSKIERGERRIDVDDLVALALALNVSPLSLLMPAEWSSNPVELTSAVQVSAQVAWLWAQGEGPAEEIPTTDDVAAHEAYWRKWEEYQALTHPPERRGMGSYMGRALGALRTETDRLTHAVRMETDEEKFDQQVERVRTWISRLEGEVDRMEAQRRGPKRPSAADRGDQS